MPDIGKGSVYSLDVATVLTAIAEPSHIAITGAKTNTMNYSNLAQAGSGELKLANGYSTNPDVVVDMFFDPASASHQAISDEITTPTTVPANQLDGQITFADAAATTLPFKVAGIGLDVDVDMDAGLTATVTHELNGQPTWAT